MKVVSTVVCKATKADGEPCANPAKTGFWVCSTHAQQARRAERDAKKILRDDFIIDIYTNEKCSLGAIGKRVGLTPEGVRLVLKRRHVQIRTKAEAACEARKKTLSTIDPEAIIAEYRLCHSVKDVSNNLGVSLGIVTDIVRARVPLAERLSHPNQMTKDPVARAQGFLQAAVADMKLTANDHMTRPMYDAWTRNNDAPQARTLVVQTGFSGWYELCFRSGVGPNYKELPGPVGRWKEDDLLVHVRQVAREIGHVPTYAEYERRARGVDWLASGSLVRRRVARSWVEVLRLSVPEMLGEDRVA